MSNAFVIIKMCYVHDQWYDISCATLYLSLGWFKQTVQQIKVSSMFTLPDLFPTSLFSEMAVLQMSLNIPYKL